MMNIFDKWDPDVDTLSLDEIYAELSRLDDFERLIRSMHVKKGPKNPDKDDKDDTNAGKDSEQAPVQNNPDNPEDPRQNTIFDDIDKRRLALRAGAMDLSRAKIRPITIVDLPADILRQILDYFQDPKIQKGQVDWGWRWPRGTDAGIARATACETIRQVRLVCNLFNELASPLLCPILRVNLDQESLDRAVQLSKRPRVAKGVRAIQVGLQYRPQELVSSCPRFKDYRKRQVDEMIDTCQRHAERHEERESTESIYRQAIRSFCEMRCAWDSYLDSGESDDGAKETDEHMEIFVRGYNEYRKKHEEQLQLITTGSFVTTLASCISQMPNVVALGFTDQANAPYDRFNPILLPRDQSLLPRFLSDGLEWQSIEDFRDAKLTPARILFELPIAIHKAGTTLRDLYIGPFPCRGSFSLICPDTVSNPTDPAAWSDLRAACSSLRRVSFGCSLNCRFIRHEHLPPIEKYYVDQYLGAILCSRDMEDVWMSFYAFSLSDGRTTMEGWYDLGSILGAVKWPRIRRLGILDVSARQDELERFCSGLGYSVQWLQLASIHLFSGGWASILDTLEEKLGSALREQKRTVYLSCLSGGEFGEKEVKKRDLLEDWFFDKDPEAEPLPAAAQVLKELHSRLFNDYW